MLEIFPISCCYVGEKNGLETNLASVESDYFDGIKIL
jgi:hypothetical protein